MTDRITVKEAAESLGVSQQFIRIGLQKGRLPIGTAVKMSSRWTYFISKTKLLHYLNSCHYCVTNEDESEGSSGTANVEISINR